VLAVVALLAAAANAADLPPLPVEDARRVERGETVVHERAVPGWPWPEAVAYRRSSAPPAAVAAVYADFASQSSYMPGLVASRVVSRDTPYVARVFYEYDVVGPNEQYVVVTTITRDGGAWELRWTLVRARYARRIEGALRIVPHGEASLLIHWNLVDPGPLGTALGSATTVAMRLRQATDALVARTERMAATEPGRLATLIAALRSGPPIREGSAP
jgi:hypothetical protein